MHTRNNLQRDFKFAVTAAPWALKGAPVLLCGEMRPQFEQAKAIGYHAIELHLRTPDDAKASEIRALCEEYGISISAVATGLSKLVDKLSFIDDDEKVRSAAVDRIKEFIDWSAMLECGIIIGSMRGNIPDLDNREKYDLRMSSCLSKILTYAEPAKVPIYLETINRYENNYLNTAQETLDYVNNFGSKFLYVHLDTFHMNIEESSMEKTIMQCGSKLGYIHFADNNRHACGEGAIDFGKVMSALKNISYESYISVECLPLPDGISAARNSITNLKGLIKTMKEKTL
jgi:sugar phosphate isomerase/epimerase